MVTMVIQEFDEHSPTKFYILRRIIESLGLNFGINKEIFHVPYTLFLFDDNTF